MLTKVEAAPGAGYPPATRAAAFEAKLGDPADERIVFSARACAELDRAEAFPTGICAYLDELGLPAWYVPVEFGGSLRSYEDLIEVVRCLARRDLTVAVAHAKTFLGAASVWVSGQPAQARALASQILAGARVSWALSEPGHGADLLASEVTAHPVGGGYLLDGTKWPVNNATLGSHACVLARTSPAGGSRGLSLLLVDKSRLHPEQYRYLPKARTLGIRGADISGISFDRARVPADALVGEEGFGLANVLLSLQLTRLICAGLSLGAGEHALTLVTGFVATRVIQGKPLIARPWVRAALARAAALLLAAEAVTVICTRAVHLLTDELAITSTVAKALVPVLIDQLIDELAELLGARSFLDDVYAYGAFQKLQRDHRIVAIFDGSTEVSQSALVGQFPRLVAGHDRAGFDPVILADLAAVTKPVPAFVPSTLRVAARTGCSVTASLSALAAQLIGSAGLAQAARDAAARGAELHRELALVRPAARPPAASHDLAIRYELCFAAAACLHLWASEHSRLAAISPLWQDGLWPRACLAELSAWQAGPGQGLSGRGVAASPELTAGLTDWLTDSVAAGQPLTLWAVS